MKTLSGILLRVLPLIIFSLVAYYVAQNYLFQENVASPPEAKIALKSLGEAAHDFSLHASSDRSKTWKLSSLKGKPIILNFWATWCAPCVKELPSLIEIAKTYRAAGLQVIAISEDKDWETVDRFFTRFPQLAPAKEFFTLLLDADGAVANQYGAAQIPESFLINRRFLIDFRLSGEQAWQDPRYTVYYDRILDK